MKKKGVRQNNKNKQKMTVKLCRFTPEQKKLIDKEASSQDTTFNKVLRDIIDNYFLSENKNLKKAFSFDKKDFFVLDI